MFRALVGLTLTLALAAGSLWVWASDAPATAGTTLDGETHFLAKGCVGCHQLGSLGELQIGPDLTDIAERATESYVRQSITEPQAYRVAGYDDIDMPTLSLTEAELDAIVAFLLEQGTGA